MTSYADILLPVPIQGAFTYAIPPALEGRVEVGRRVIVPFGRKKFYTGIVTGVSPRRPEGGYEVKEILMLLDERPVVRHPQLKFWNWIAEYYLCSPGDVYKAAVPSGLKVESETFVEPCRDWEEDAADRLGEREAVVMNLLLTSDKRLSVEDVRKATGFTSAGAVITRLLERGAVMISEKLVERYRSRKEPYVRLAFPPDDREAMQGAFDAVKGAAKQEKALLALIDLSARMRRDAPSDKEVSRAELLERSGVTTTILAAMAKKGIIENYRKEINRFRFTGLTTGELPALTDAQNVALDAVHKSWLGHEVTLLHGVTSSGKTEVYIHLADYVLRQRRQILYLVPEIALTTQLTGRLQNVFGDKVVIYHSKFSDNERVDIWKKMLESSEPCIVIGARSSVFLPFASLGLVIVDEEHESSYKQQDPAPRYNARDAAIVLAGMHGAKTLLGSATPAIDTYYKATTGRYGLVELTERYEGVRLPEVRIVDMGEERKRGTVRGIFSLATRNLVNKAVDSGEQAILFINRRGYAPVARCKQCGFVPKCDRCDVSLTYHRRIDRLVCHYCGSPYAVPDVCPACGEPSIEVLGYGTERVEDEVAENFPEAVISRLDLDTTRNKDSYETIIDEFSSGKSQILVGTQMVTKGLDFGKVSVVGVVNADAVINFPDFRSGERAFNMIEQVAGRAGRRTGNGIVAVQTYNPSHPVLAFVKAHDYTGFYAHEIEERRLFHYPPFVRIIYIYLKHKDETSVVTSSRLYAERLRQLLGNRVNGPDEPTVSRVQSLYIRRVMLKIETGASIAKVKALLRSVQVELAAARVLNGIILYYDIDPM